MNLSGSKFHYKWSFFCFIFIILSNSIIWAQSSNAGIVFQALARDVYNNPANSRKVYIQTSILQFSKVGNNVLSEEHITNTDNAGIFTISIGLGSKIGGSKLNLQDIDWSNGPYYLNMKIAITPVSPTDDWYFHKEWIDLGTTSFGVVPYALHVLGSKNTTSISIDSSILKSKISLSDSLLYVTPYQLSTKTFNLEPINKSLNSKLSYSDTASMLVNYIREASILGKLDTKLNLSDTALMINNRFARDTISLSNRINSKIDFSNKSLNINLPSDYNNDKYPTVKAIKDYVDLKLNTLESNLSSSSDYIFTAPLINSSNTIQIPIASSSSDGYLSTIDWISFNNKLNSSQKGSINGLATLGADGKIPSIQIPAISFSRVDVVANQTEMLSLPVTLTGSFAIRTDQSRSYVLSALPASNPSNWIEIVSPGNVTSVNGKSGPSISLTTLDISSSVNKNYVTDAMLSGVLSNTSGVNTGDETAASIKSKLGVTILSGSNTGDQDLSGYATTTSLNLKANASDVTSGLALKVDKVTGKELSSNDYTTTEKNKLAAITGSNTGDQVLPTLTSLGAVAGNAAIIGASKTKITYDSKGLVTAGADATTADIAASTNKNYVTDAMLSGVLSNTSGVNTGDETAATIKSKLGVTTLSGSNTGDQDLSGYATITNLNLKANASDVTNSLALKVDKVVGKELSSNDYTTTEKNKLAAITGSNTGDQTITLTGVVTGSGTGTFSTTIANGAITNAMLVNSAVANLSGTNTGDETATTIKSKLGVTTLSGSNTGDQDLSGYATTSSLALKVDKVAGKELSTNDYTTAERNKLAAITGTNTGDQVLPTLTSLGAVAGNAAITGASKTKITYDSKGLVTAGADATTADIAASTNKNYVTDAMLSGVLSNTTGVNTGDQILPTLTSLGAVASNTAITGASKTKITYDSKGLVTAGADATTADIAASTNKNYVTDAMLSGVLSNTSGINTGDETATTIKSKLGVTTLTGSNTGDQILPTLTSLGAVAGNAAITGATKTKITYDAKGLVTSGTDATTADIAASANKNYVTDAMLSGVLSNTSGVNTGDQILPTLSSLGAVASNAAITGASKTKITYDSKGLVTAGADATTADIAASTNKNYVTDAMLSGVLSNTSGVNTGDETAATIKSKLGVTTLSGSNTGDQDLSGYATITNLNLKANASDVTNSLVLKVDKVVGKELSSNDYTTTEKNKLAAITGSNTGDQDLSGYATITNLNLKANATDVTNSLALKVDKVAGKELSSNDYTTTEKNKLAAITGSNTGDQVLPTLTSLGAVAGNAAIAGASKTKITYDSKGLVTAGADATTADIAASTNKNYVTDAMLSGVLSNTSGVNTGDETATTIKSKLGVTTLSGSNTGDQDLSAYATTTSLNLKANASDVTSGLALKVDKVTGKELSTNDYTTAEKTKLAAITGSNTGDQDLSGYATSTSLALKVDKVTGKELSTNDYTTAEKTKLAAITGSNTGDQVLPTLTSLGAVAGNAAIIGASKTKITYDSKGLVTAGADATTADIAASTNKNYVTDAMLSGVLSNTTGVNTGDETATTIKSKLGVVTLSGSNTGDQDLSGYATTTNLNLKANASDVTNSLALKVDKVAGKELSTNDYTTAEKTKLAAITGSNTGDQILPTLSSLGAVAGNAAITGASKTKITYDSKGLVTAGADATTADIAASTNKNYVTDAMLSGVLSNTTGINTGDETAATIKSKLGVTTLSGSNTGDQDLSGYATTTSLALKVDKVVGKELSSNDYTTTEKNKLAAITGSNTGDQVLPTLSSLGAVAGNAAIAGASKTKITYDSKGLVTAGADATTADIAASTNKNYVTDAMLSGVLSNTSGVNTGDETAATIKSKLGVTTLSGSNTGDQDLSGYATITNLNLKANASDVTNSLALKVDKVVGKELSSNDYTTTEKNKLAAITGSNTGDQDLSGYATTSSLALKVDKVAGKELSTNDYTTAEKTKLAAITGSNTGDQTITLTGVVTGSGTGTFSTTIANGAITNAMLAAIPGVDYQVPNAAITGASKTKITYDSKGLVTAGADATTADIAASTNKNYVTDAMLSGVLSNTTGVNTGDETSATIKSKLGVTTLSGSNTGDQDLSGYATTTSLDLKANLISPILVTPTLGDASATSIATTSVNATGDVTAKRFKLTMPSAITATPSTTIDLSGGNVFTVNMVVNISTLTLSNAVVGTYLIKFVQDAAGSKDVTFPTAWKWAGGYIPNLTNTGTKLDFVTLIYDGTTFYATIVQNF